MSRALDDSDTALSIRTPDEEDDPPIPPPRRGAGSRLDGHTRFLGDKDSSQTRLSAARTDESQTRPSAGNARPCVKGEPERAGGAEDEPESLEASPDDAPEEPAPSDPPAASSRVRRRDPSRFGLEVRSDGRSFYLPAPLAIVMATCVVLVGVLAAFDPGELAFAAVDRHADRIARWEALEHVRRQAAVDTVEAPLRALRRQALQRGLPPEGLLAPSACAGEPAAHLEAHADEIARLSAALAASAAGDESPDAHLPSRSPIDLTKGEFFLAPDTHIPGTVRVSSSRGPRTDPIDGNFKDHKGIDISAPVGTEVIATADGTVVYAGSADPGVDHLRSLLGTHVVVEHGETGFVTLYAHLSRADVKEGQAVRSGDLLGAVGSTGRSTGPHLHYQVMKGGRSLDPLLYIADVVLIEDGEAIRWRRNR